MQQNMQGFNKQNNFSGSNPLDRLGAKLNFSVPTQPAPAPQQSNHSLQEYIGRCFKKCITVSERLEMSKRVNKLVETYGKQ